MPSLEIPRAFLVSERDNVYSDWCVSFWREFLSNCADAGATAVKIRTSFEIFKDEPVMRVVVHDNGSGMSQDIVENVYMRLGESTKADAGDGVGGYGRARILTTFSHPRYSIASGDFVVDGEGTNYLIRPSTKPIRGCAVIVDVESRFARRLHEGLFDFLETSNPKMNIALELAQSHPDGLPLRTIKTEPGKPVLWKGAYNPGRRLSAFADETGTWAKVSVNDGPSALQHKLVVRVNGLAMHTEFLGEPIQVSIDLVPSRSRAAMTASRDALRKDFRQNLMRFVQRLSADVMDTIRAREGRREVLIEGREGVMKITRSDAKSDEGKSGRTRRFGARRLARSHPDPTRTTAPRDKVERRPANAMLRTSFALLIDDVTPDQRRVIEKYHPDHWADGGFGTFSVQRLLSVWTEAMRLSVERLMEQHQDMDRAVRLRCGFVLGQSQQACLKEQSDGSYLALINPIDAAGKPRFRLTDQQDRKKIAMLAMHEACHLLSDLHTEYFALALTELAGSFRDIDFDRNLRLVMDETAEELKSAPQPTDESYAEPAP
jgi:hypothetical protein